MSNYVARFEKVSYEQFKKDWLKNNSTNNTKWDETTILAIYDDIELPKRGTSGSAGYDLHAPIAINLPFNESIVIPTGIRCVIDDGWFLDLNPRSGHGFNYGIRLANTRGIINTDYYFADNEGHIMVKIVNESVACGSKMFSVEKGKGFCQGIFTVYGLVEGDDAFTKRTGGIGSTDEPVNS